MTLVLPERLIAPGVAANLGSFDPDPLTTYVTSAGDTLGAIAKRFYGAAHADLLALLAEANGIRPAAVLPGGVNIVVPQPLYRVLIV